MASAIKKLKVSGKSLLEKGNSQAEESRFSDLVKVQCKASIQVEYNRDDSRLVEVADVQQDDVVELEFEGGFKEWVRGSDLSERLDHSQVRSHDGLIITPNSLRYTNDTDNDRGLIGLALKFLKVLKIDPIASLVDLSVAALTERFEGKQIAQPGVYQYQHKGLETLKYCQSDIDISIDANKPVLLFIHGTFSSSKGSFGDLWDSGNNTYIDQLLHPYGDQVFFVEHFTLSVSPVHNALMVARLFPTGTRFHIISHSRGGLVGELLAQGRLKRRADSGSFTDSDAIFTEGELRIFKGDEHRKDDYRDLKQLQQLLQVREIYVERFVRIAAPARGTLLASDNIEDMLNAAYNVLNLIPVPQLVGVAEFIKMLLLTLVKQRKKVNVLPGIESMIPTSPLIALLNRHSVQLENELTVIAGEIQGAGFIGRLKAWIANKIFVEDHDFVVNTAAMYGGCPRVNQACRYHLEKGNGASHFKYFQNVTVRQRIKEALHQPLGELGAFLPFPDHQVRNSATRDSGAVKHTSLYFIPSVFGSALSASGLPIWMDIAALQWGDFSNLRLNKAGVKAKQLVDGHYEDLLGYLSDTHKIIPFAYDWRRSYLLAGRKLGETISQHLDQIEQSGEKHTIRLLAHSTGGLVIKAMMLEYPMIWERLMQTDAQVVMLGTPLAGSYRMVQLLVGQHRLTQLMHMLENPLDEHSIVNQFAQYPGILELLPHNENKSYFDADVWKNILPKAQKESWTGFAGLAAAKEVREQLDDIAISDWSRICYVAGQARLTPTNLSIKDGQLTLLATRTGDGFSAWDDNKPAANKCWFVPTEHGNLVRYSSAYKGILDLLQSGNTQQLSTELPARSDDEERLPDNTPSLYPDKKEILAAALCFPTKASQQDMQVSVDIKVLNGNLEHVKNAIVVGHYDGDSIVNAEHVIDQRLNGRLRELHRLGMYPGALNTSKVLLNDSKRPSGVIIAGLGDVGKLSTGDLLETYTHALLDFAMLMRDQHQYQENQSGSAELISLSISTLLVGSGFGGLQIQESIICILRAIKRANKALRKNHQGRISAITSVEFIELYEDRAIETIKALQKIVAHYEYSEQFALQAYLGSLPGASRRVMFGEQTGWWQRIQIEGNKAGLLRYLTLTNRARAEAELLPTQSKLVDKFVSVATKDSYDDSEIRKTLFELLVPNDLKDHTHDLENLVLILNGESAGLPWELLQNRLDVGADPISVGAGMLRQLQTEHFREVVINPSKRMALVVGNPKTTHFSDLVAATDEAKNVSKQLIQQGFEVKSEVESSARSILNALHNSDYRVLHLAGHGVFNYDHNGEYEKPVTGMVLGDDIYLTPIEIRQMRKVPEFAFINCCHLGKMEDDPKEAREDRHKLAANIAAELISMGVKAVVAAGWTIKDSAAQCFAEEFYDKLLSGHTFGESVISARKKTFDEYETSNTWGAYQCYGDPDYVLTHHASSDAMNVHSEEDKEYRFVSENEVVVTLQNLSNSADSARVDSFKSLNQRLSSIEQAIPIDWLKKSCIRHALGRAHGKLDNFKDAIDHYKATQSIQLANYPVSMLEDLVSLKTAWALALHEDGEQKQRLYPENSEIQTEAKASIENANQQIKEALTILDLLDQLGLSIERWEERGKAWKRKAMISKGRARSTALRKMQEAYHKAHNMALEHFRDVSPYPLVNWQTAKIVRHLRNKRNKLDKSDLIYWLNQARQCALNIDANEHSFCSGITLAECTILSYIIETDSLSKNDIVDQTVGYYSKAIERGAAPRQIRFVSEHLLFLINMLENRQSNDEVSSIVKVLNKVLEMLDSSLRGL